jgi:hypothetical protein
MSRRVPETIDCECNACGKVAKCRPDQPAPVGWYYIHEPGHDFRHCVGVLACSENCRVTLAWRRSE